MDAGRLQKYPPGRQAPNLFPPLWTLDARKCGLETPNAIMNTDARRLKKFSLDAGRLKKYPPGRQTYSPPNISMAKLSAYNIRVTSMKLYNNWLGEFSIWEGPLTAGPQESVFGPLLFDLYYVVDYTDICNFADDFNPHSSSTDINEALT